MKRGYDMTTCQTTCRGCNPPNAFEYYVTACVWNERFQTWLCVRCDEKCEMEVIES